MIKTPPGIYPISKHKKKEIRPSLRSVSRPEVWGWNFSPKMSQIWSKSKFFSKIWKTTQGIYPSYNKFFKFQTQQTIYAFPRASSRFSFYLWSRAGSPRLRNQNFLKMKKTTRDSLKLQVCQIQDRFENLLLP